MEAPPSKFHDERNILVAALEYAGCEVASSHNHGVSLGRPGRLPGWSVVDYLLRATEHPELPAWVERMLAAFGESGGSG